MAELNIRKRGQKWEYRFEGSKIQGKRNQLSKGGFKTKRECVEAGTLALAEFNRAGILIVPSDISVSDYLDYWFDSYCKMNLKYNTQLNYIQLIENHLKPAFGQYKLKALNPTAIQDYTNNLKIKGFSKSHVVGIISTLSGALNYAIEPLQYITTNSCDRIKYPKFEDVEKKRKEKRFIISTSDFNKILERFPQTEHFYTPLMIGFYTGLRISECFALTWEDINFEKSTISISKETIKRNFGVDVRQVLLSKGKKEEKSAWYFDSPKNETSNRTIKIGVTLCNVLINEKVKQDKNRAIYGEYYNIHYLKKELSEKGDDIFRIISVEACIQCSMPQVNLICVRENGEFVSTDSFKYCSRVINHDLNINFNYHSLRHTHATMLVEAGVNIKAIQDRLGHAKITTTLQTYTHTTQASEDNLVDVFDNILL